MMYGSHIGIILTLISQIILKYILTRYNLGIKSKFRFITRTIKNRYGKFMDIEAF